MDVTHIVAANVKNIREAKKLTLDAAAALTGVSRSMLAQIEKGDVNPTISVLWKIANGFKVSFTALMENKDGQVSIVRAKDTKPFIEDDGRYINYPIFPFEDQAPFESYRIVIAPQGSLEAQPHLPGTEEYITVFSGEVDLVVGGESHHLGPGDSIRFKADVPHSYCNPENVNAELSMLIHYA